MRGAEYGLRTEDVGDAFLAETAKSVSGFQGPPAVSSNFADDACPSATVTDTLSLAPKLFDVIPYICHQPPP
jgi:hypothetical protein